MSGVRHGNECWKFNKTPPGKTQPAARFAELIMGVETIVAIVASLVTTVSGLGWVLDREYIAKYRINQRTTQR